MARQWKQNASRCFVEKTGCTFAVVLDFRGTAVFSGMIGVTCSGLLFTRCFMS
jgi:hypothetical protein